MFESLVESPNAGRPFWRPATFGVAFGLHLCLLTAVLVENHLRPAPAASELPIEVSFLRFAPRPVVPAAGPARTEATPGTAAAPTVAQPEPQEARESAHVPIEMVQPQKTPETISTAPEPVAVAVAATPSPAIGAGVEGGVPGGVPGGIPGGPVVPAGPLWAGGEITAPVVIHRVQPAYPIMAQNARVEGAVKLEAVILRDGQVGDIRVVQGLRFGCTQAAIEALKNWRFQPGEYRGIPADVYFELTVDFILN